MMGPPLRTRFAPKILVWSLLLTGRAAGTAQAVEEFRIDAAASTMMVQVGRAGLFGFAGHNHEVAVPAMQGRVILDRTDVSRSSLSIRFDAAAMKVTGKGEPPEDVPEVQRVMLSERVLNVERHPSIEFISRRISITKRAGDLLTVRIDGQLTLRGVSQPVRVPAEVRLSAGQISATGKVTVRQTDFGIRPVTAGAGTVRVKDEVEVVFTIIARG